MRPIYFVIVMSMFIAACSFDSSGLNAVNTNNTNNINLCENIDCSGHGTCVVEDATAICNCEGNFVGENCGECVTGFFGENCDECATGYTGDDCTDCATDFIKLEDESCVADPCDVDSCSGNGECSPDLLTGDASCFCHVEYAGLDCSYCADGYILFDEDCIEDPCLGFDCSGHGECKIDWQAVPSCDCATGYIGESCDTCDATNNYILHQEECKLDPCAGMDCGVGECVLNTDTFIASCDCQGLALGGSCEYPYADLLIYQVSMTEIAVQVKDPRWGDFQLAIQFLYAGHTMDGTNVLIRDTDTSYFLQTDVGNSSDGASLDGFLVIEPCAAGFDEFVWFRLSDTPHTEYEMLDFENLATLAWYDPQGFIWTDPSDPNKPKFRVQCHNGQIVGAGGELEFIFSS